jgi:hypothetical protein
LNFPESIFYENVFPFKFFLRQLLFPKKQDGRSLRRHGPAFLWARALPLFSYTERGDFSAAMHTKIAASDSRRST